MNILQVISNKAISRFADKTGSTVHGIGVNLPGNYAAYCTPSDKGVTAVLTGPGVHATLDGYSSTELSEHLLVAYYTHMEKVLRGALHDAMGAAADITGATYDETELTLTKDGVTLYAQLDTPSSATDGYGVTWSVYDPGSDEPAETDGIAYYANIEQFAVNLFVTLAWKMEQ